MQTETKPSEIKKKCVTIIVGSNIFPTTKIEFLTTEEGITKIIKCASEIISAAMPNVVDEPRCDEKEKI